MHFEKWWHDDRCLCKHVIYVCSISLWHNIKVNDKITQIKNNFCKFIKILYNAKWRTCKKLSILKSMRELFEPISIRSFVCQAWIYSSIFIRLHDISQLFAFYKNFFRATSRFLLTIKPNRHSRIADLPKERIKKELVIFCCQSNRSSLNDRFHYAIIEFRNCRKVVLDCRVVR